AEGARVAVVAGLEDARDEEARAAVVEVGAHRVRQVVRSGGEVLEAAVDALEVREAGEELGGLLRHAGDEVGALPRLSDEAGGAGARPFDGLRPEARLLDVDAWGKVFGHGKLSFRNGLQGCRLPWGPALENHRGHPPGGEKGGGAADQER